MKLISNNALIACIFLSLLLASTWYISSTQKKRASTTSALINHTQEVLLHSEQLLVNATDNQTGSRGYVITGNTAFLDSLETSKRNIHNEIRALRLLTSDNVLQQMRIDSIELYASKRMDWSDSIIRVRNQQSPVAAAVLVNTGEGRQYARRFRLLVKELQQVENNLLKIRRASNEEAEEMLDKTFIIGAIILLFLMLVLFQKTRLDIRAQKKTAASLQVLNNDLQQKVKELDDANNEMEAFTYSVSHDLRAPLRRITGFTSILEEEHSDKLDDEGRRITGIIKKNTIRMGNLINDLLTFSRVARKDLVKTPVVSNDIVREVIEGTETINGSAEHPVKWTVHSLPGVQGDVSALRQVWFNLISNAVKYSRNTGQSQVEIGSFIKNNQTVFFIQDNGVGFDAQYSDKLFKVFHRLHSEQEFEGSGVGLAIVEKIISKHGGHVWAKGEVDKGATFYFSLPSGA